jgi:hypothetical protein
MTMAETMVHDTCLLRRAHTGQHTPGEAEHCGGCRVESNLGTFYSEDLLEAGDNY